MSRRHKRGGRSQTRTVTPAPQAPPTQATDDAASEVAPPLSRNGDAPSRHFVVGIGASAGGLDAIERFFDRIPLYSGLTFILVQHLSPDFKSLMDELLARHTALPIRRVENGMSIAPNAVYLIPPKKNMVLASQQLLLTDQEHGAGLNLPIDIFFRSLAQDAGDRAIGVILSGTGSDGSRGAKEIHEAGGLVVVQDPESASFDGMPKAAIATGMADLVLAPEAMPEKILQYVRHPASFAAEEEKLAEAAGDELQPLFNLLRRQHGIDFALYRPTTVTRRLARRMKLGNAGTVAEYVDLLKRDPAELEALHRDLLVEVTQFFRDKEAFELLRGSCIPVLAEGATPEGIRVWVPGCATGEEAYSLAMLFQEWSRAHERPLDVKIFATDVHRASLDVASAGEYTEHSVSEVPRDFRERYFTRRRDAYLVVPELRKMVIFAPHNLTKDPPFTKLDLISCRNLLIYIKPQTQKKILTLFHFGLKTGGVLLLGPSESVADIEGEFEVVDSRWKLFRKRRDVRLLTDTRLLATSPFSGGGRSRFTAQEGERSGLAFPELYTALLERFVPPGLLVSEDHRLLHVFGDARRYLQVPAGKATVDVLRLVDGSLRLALSSALHRAAKEKQPVVYGGVDAVVGERQCRVRVTAEQLADPRSAVALYLVTLIEEQQPAPPVPASEEPFNLDGESAERISALERELVHAKEHLQSTVEELETSNEELQAANEELVAANEELQSTNEELHSVNEELYTVNAEHQRKIEELTQLTNDMDNLLHSIDIGTVFLDTDLNVRKFTPASTRVFKLLPQDLGRPLPHIAHQLNLPGGELVALIDQVRTSLRATEVEVETGAGAAFLLRVHPYRTAAGEVSGSVLTLVDVSAFKEAQRQLESNQRRLQLALKAGEICTWDWDRAADRLSVGPRFFQFFELEATSFRSTMDGFVELTHPDDRPAVREALLRVAAGDRPRDIDHRVVLPGGKLRAVTTRAEASRDPAGQATRLVGVCINVTERKRMEEELRESRQRLQAILDNSTALISAKDRRGRYILANRQFAAVLGRPPEQILGKTDRELQPGPGAEARRKLDREVARTEAVSQTEELMAKGDREHTFLAVRCPLLDGDGEVYAVACIATDITDRKRAETEVREALILRDQFLAMLSHELRNPLGAVLNAAQLLLHRGTGDGARAEAADVIRRQAEQMDRLLDDLLDVSRIAQNKIRFREEVVDLGETIREAVRVVSPVLARLAFTQDLPGPGVLFVRGDGARLQQVLVNLLTNAGKYTPPGGTVHLEAGLQDGRAILRVRDSGVGIRPEMLERIFEPFVQAAETLDRSGGGMGVGLALVRSILLAHGGEVEARSDGAGRGSEFVVRLPVAAASPTGDPQEGSRRNEPRQRTIVIVEDNEDSRTMLASLLRLEGFEVRAVGDGREGLATILQRHPGMAFVDIGLPGLNGYEVARGVRARMPDGKIYLVALTGYGRDEDHRAVVAAGFNEHLVKPLKPAALRRLLDTLYPAPPQDADAGS